ncbi:MAG: hypothetical protein WCI71_03750 [Bacteroidota bacterium]
MKKILLLFLFIAAIVAGSCRKQNPEPPAPIVFTTFLLNGVENHFTSATKFSKDFCSSSTFCCRFYKNVDSETSEQLKIGIPGDPIVGHVYQTGENRFSCFYINGAGTRYDLTASPFRLIFTLWEGQGGWAKGSFSGWMASATGDSIHFESGFFQNNIWTLVP